MKRVGIPYILLLTVFFSISSSHASERIAMDLINYVNQELHNIAEIERKSLEQYASVIGVNYTTDERVYKMLEDEVIPLYHRFYILLKKVTPKTDEVKELHQIYIQAAALKNEGFRMKKLGLEIHDERVIKKANQKIEKGRYGVEEWKERLLKLCKEHGVKLKTVEKKGLE